MRVALIYPPTCDPTAPYLAVPMLTGFLRAHGVEVLPIDANLEAYDELLEPGPLAGVRDRLEERLERLERKSSLNHGEQLAYGALWRARGDAHAAPDGITRAKKILRDRSVFFDPEQYGSAVETVEAALRAISAAHGPLHLDFTAYRTPFSLLSIDEITADAQPHRDPFDSYITGTLAPRLAAAQVDVVGLSVCFPGQLQPAYAFALKLKKLLPGVHFTVGGPGVTQMLIRLQGAALARALGPFDSAVVFEGESSLLALLRALDERRSLRDLTNVVLRDPLLGARYLPGHGMEDLKTLPAPDFDGLPLDRYLSPQLVLPYDPTRGCYWGKCTFCHYGLAEVGTAAYRERQVPAMVEHLRSMAARYRTRHFYLSQDSVAPKTLLKLAEGLLDAGLDLRWATDLKAEKYLTPERAQTLKRSGAVACAIGVESGNDRVLSMIDKGAPVAVVRDVMVRLSEADVAVEAMCFTDFPTETAAEALDTVRMLDNLRDHVALFIVGQFGLTHGALVAQDPQKFGLQETWQLAGDELGLGLFFQEQHPPKSDQDRARVDRALDRLSSGWWLRHYPWAGALSTAHTLLFYDRMGKDAFRRLARAAPEVTVFGSKTQVRPARFDLEQAALAEDREQQLWHQIVHEIRRVSREVYRDLAARLPSLKPRPGSYSFTAAEHPTPTKTPGRRPSHASNAPTQSTRR
ncbi:MAG: radical SAM protein [Polyangiaceae bacterium]|jgi:hypothetical protein|nr:radical SAM protein [Polyangiaceae bacterium]